MNRKLTAHNNEKQEKTVYLLTATGLFFLLTLFFWPHFSLAAPVTASLGRSFTYKIEPIVGFEQVFRATPTPHTSSRATYGARLTVGTERLAVEAEYLKAEDTENYAAAPEKIVNKDDKIKLGAKTSYGLSNSFFLAGRAGGQASRNINETTTSGVLSVKEGEFQYHPYAGAALGVRLGKDFSITLGSTMIFKDLSDLTKNDFQNTVSFGYNIN